MVKFNKQKGVEEEYLHSRQRIKGESHRQREHVSTHTHTGRFLHDRHVLTAILHTEGLQVRCYHTGDVQELPPAQRRPLLSITDRLHTVCSPIGSFLTSFLPFLLSSYFLSSCRQNRFVAAFQKVSLLDFLSLLPVKILMLVQTSSLVFSLPSSSSVKVDEVVWSNSLFKKTIVRSEYCGNMAAVQRELYFMFMRREMFLMISVSP